MTSLSYETSRPPVRPSISPALYALVVIIIVERCVLRVGGHSSYIAWGDALLAASLSLSWAGYRSRRIPRTACEVIGCCLCASLAASMVSGLLLARGRSFADAMESSAVSRWGFEAVSDALPTQHGFRCRAKAFRDGAPTGCVWLSSSEQLERGDVVWGVGRFAANANDEWGESNRMQGVWGSVKLVMVRSRSHVAGAATLPLELRKAVRTTLDPSRTEGRAILAGCLIGDRRYLVERHLDQLFARCGVAHLVAVSGSHLVVVSSLLTQVFKRMRARPAVRAFLLLALTGCFVITCGAPASAVRAWLMSALSDGGRLLGRRGDALSSVCLVALAMALVDPSLSGQAGYLLSVACVIALALFSSYFSYLLDVALPGVWVPRTVPSEVRIRLRSLRRDVVRGLSASTVCLVATIPLVTQMTARISLVGPLVALPASALLTLAMSLALVGSCCSCIPACGTALIDWADLLLGLSLGLMRCLSRMPLATVAFKPDQKLAATALVLVAAALVVTWPVPSKGVARGLLLSPPCLGCALILAWTVCAPTRVCILDVGQGDAILVQDGWRAILVDTGPDGSVVSALSRKHVLRLDAVVLTHLHDDHYGGVEALVGSMPCAQVFVADGVAEYVPPELAEDIVDLTGKPCAELSYGDVLKVGRFALEVIWPHGPVAGDTNPDSLMMVASYQSGEETLSALLTGDAEWEELGSALATGDVPDIDVLKVGHHGSDASIRPEQAAALRAEVAVASAGKGNDYGHPKEECVKVLTDAGALFLCTADSGDVDLRPSRSGIRCLTTRKGYGRPSSTTSSVKVMSGSAPLLRARSQRAQETRPLSRLPGANLRAQPTWFLTCQGCFLSSEATSEACPRSSSDLAHASSRRRPARSEQSATCDGFCIRR